MSTDDVFGDVIYGYSRAQAIEDGVLVDLQGDLGKLVKEAGFKYPAVMTSSAWEAAVACDDRQPCQSLKGRLWDVLFIMRHAKMRGDRTDPFTVSVLGMDGKRRNVSLWGHCGPGDTAAPVLTIMLEGED